MVVSIQRSSYGDLRGVVQVMDDLPGVQLIGALNAVNARLGYTTASTPRVTVNEAFRPKARQQKLLNAYLVYRAYGTPYAALAASPLYSSNHGPDGDITKSIAADLGVTEVDGTNRALNVAEQGAWRSLEQDYGFISAGDGFFTPEPWHKEFQIEPRVWVPVGTKIATIAPSDDSTSQKEKAMLRQATGAKAGSNGDIGNFVFFLDPIGKTARRITNTNELNELKKDFTLRGIPQAVVWDFVRPDSIGYKRIGF